MEEIKYIQPHWKSHYGIKITFLKTANDNCLSLPNNMVPITQSQLDKIGDGVGNGFTYINKETPLEGHFEIINGIGYTILQLAFDDSVIDTEHALECTYSFFKDQLYNSTWGSQENAIFEDLTEMVTLIKEGKCSIFYPMGRLIRRGLE